jgi:secreted trypsin-like serine protease
MQVTRIFERAPAPETLSQPNTQQKENRMRRGIITVAAVLLTAGAGTATMAAAANGGGVQPDIIGGHEATAAPPGIVSLQYDAPDHGDRYVNYHTCGGSLVFRGWVLTNAHCVTDMPAGANKAELAARFALGWQASSIPVKDKHFHVRVGSTDRTQGGETADVTRIVVHPGWNWGIGAPDKEVDDTAMLKLDHLVQQPTIPLASASARPGDKVSLYGWGDTEPDSNSPNLPIKLQQLDTVIAPPSKCADAALSAREICTNNPNGTDGPCYGDSGGPAVKAVNGVPQLVGGTSRSAEQFCGITGNVYTSQPEFRDWIYAVARGSTG